ncbi:MAG: hypothetical protein ACOVVK_18220, partial [Elsteraceae bacterium]
SAPPLARVAPLASAPSRPSAIVEAIVAAILIDRSLGAIVFPPAPPSLTPSVNFALGGSFTSETPAQQAEPNAQAAQQLVTATPSGAFIPISPATVGGTGAPLVNAPTIKVDAADTGGANGQVIASVVSGESNSKSVVPGLLSETTTPANRVNAGNEPPLAQQPSQMNEESLLD